MACYNFFDRLKQFLNNKFCRRATIVFFLFLLFFCIGKCSSYATTEIDYSSIVEGAYISSNGAVVSSDSYDVYVYDLVSGHSYTFYNNAGGTRRIAFSSDSSVSVGDSLIGFQSISKGSEYSFVVNSNVRLLAMSSNNGSVNVHLVDNGIFTYDMGTSLNKLITSTDFWSPFRDSIPFVLVVVLVALGFMFISFLLRRFKR